MEQLRSIASVPSGGGEVFPASESLTSLTAALDSSSVAIKTALGKLSYLYEDIDEVWKKRKDLAERTSVLEERVRRYNRGDLDRLGERLNDTLQDELRRRDGLDALVAERKRRASEIAKEISVGGISVLQLEEALDELSIVKESEEELEDWVLSVAREKLDDAKKAEEEIFEARTIERLERSECVTPLELAEMVQSEIVKHAADGTGRIDHASLDRGGVVVFADDAYEPNTNDGSQYVQLGQVWWRRYIPEDVEDLMPDGWEDFSVPENIQGAIPAFLKRNLNIAAVSK